LCADAVDRLCATLAATPGAAPLTQTLTELGADAEHTLAVAERDAVLAQCGLVPKLGAMDSHRADGVDLAGIAGLSASDIGPPVRAFVRALAAFEPRFVRLVRAPRVRARIARDAAMQLLDTALALRATLRDPGNSYPDSRGAVASGTSSTFVPLFPMAERELRAALQLE
jgi:hypothetical protein